MTNWVVNWLVMAISFIFMVFFAIGAGCAIIDRRKPYLNIVLIFVCGLAFIMAASDL